MRLVKKAAVKVEVKWVRGYRKDPLNKRVDKLAMQSAKTPTAQKLGHQRVRRKKRQSASSRPYERRSWTKCSCWAGDISTGC